MFQGFRRMAVEFWRTWAPKFSILAPSVILGASCARIPRAEILLRQKSTRRDSAGPKFNALISLPPSTLYHYKSECMCMNQSHKGHKSLNISETLLHTTAPWIYFFPSLCRFTFSFRWSVNQFFFLQTTRNHMLNAKKEKNGFFCTPFTYVLYILHLILLS